MGQEEQQYQQVSQQQPPQYQQQPPQYQQQPPQYQQQQQPVYVVSGTNTLTIGKVPSGNCCVPIKFSPDYPIRLTNIMSREEYKAAVDELNEPLSSLTGIKIIYLIFVLVFTFLFFFFGTLIAIILPVIGWIIWFVALFIYVLVLSVPQYFIRNYLVGKITTTVENLNATYGNRGINFRRNSFGGMMFYRRRSYLASTVIEIEIMPRGNPNMV
eukprot:TRINITY_DN633_c0_g1_i1.p1 TRINITY_DN633_c0_g1~~TRINITY_DN633_c0_g1_i1.p1  ORF type:complete len:213 (+),score=67.04 TRINITY_DN633_c0_g1_i1:42-680(+)